MGSVGDGVLLASSVLGYGGGGVFLGNCGLGLGGVVVLWVSVVWLFSSGCGVVVVVVFFNGVLGGRLV